MDACERITRKEGIKLSSGNGRGATHTGIELTGQNLRPSSVSRTRLNSDLSLLLAHIGHYRCIDILIHATAHKKLTGWRTEHRARAKKSVCQVSTPRNSRIVLFHTADKRAACVLTKACSVPPSNASIITGPSCIPSPADKILVYEGILVEMTDRFGGHRNARKREHLQSNAFSLQ